MYRLLMYLSLALFILTPIVGLGILEFENVVYGYWSGVHEYFVGGFLLASLLSFVAGIVYGLAKGEDDAVAKLTCVIGVIAFVTIVGLVGADNFRNIVFFIAILSVIAVIIAALIKK